MRVTIKCSQVRRLKDLTLYIRAQRVYHAVKRRSKRDRDAAAQNLRGWRDDCWQSYRQLVEQGIRGLPGSPWAFASCRTSLKWA